jgi:hypothetical protein
MSTRTHTRAPRSTKPVVITEVPEQAEQVVESEVFEVSTDLVVQVHEAEIMEESTDEPAETEPETTPEQIATPLYTVFYFGAADQALTYRGAKSHSLLDDEALEDFRSWKIAPVAGKNLSGSKRLGILTIHAVNAEGEIVATLKPQVLKAARIAALSV